MAKSGSAVLRRARVHMITEPQVVFADENARIAWEVSQELRKFESELPAETPTMKAKTIAFDPAHQARGTYTVLFAGTSVGTKMRGVYVVPERTLIALERLGIPYREI